MILKGRSDLGGEKLDINQWLIVGLPVVWDSNRGTPKNPNPFHFWGS